MQGGAGAYRYIFKIKYIRMVGNEGLHANALAYQQPFTFLFLTA